MSADNVIPLPNTPEFARIVQQLADFRERGEALHADMMAFANELPDPDEQWKHPSVPRRKLAHLHDQLITCLESLSDAVDGYLVPPGDGDDLAIRAGCAVRQIGRIAAGLEVEVEEERTPSAPANVIYPGAFRR